METITPIGVTNYRNNNTPFGIKAKDRAGHIYCIGKTGVGKSTLLLTMAIADIAAGASVAVIDPHGDLANTILQYIPAHRIDDVIYFDTSSTTPIAYNPLYNIPDTEKYAVAAALVLVFKKLWADSWGPRLEHILRNAIHTLTYYPNATLLDIQPLLTDYTLRREVLSYITDKHLQRFWHNEFEPLSPQMKAEHIASIVNKIGILAAHPTINAIVGATASAYSIADIYTKPKIFIANLSKGSIGEAGAALLGAMLITDFQIHALRRNTTLIADRFPVYLYIDEIHSFATDSFVDILSESRKYNLCLFITHQYTEQLPESILQGILGNVGTLIAFRVGARDAQLLEQEFAPTFSAQDLITLPRYSIYIKLLIDGATSKPFSASTLPITQSPYFYQDYIKQESMRKYHTAHNQRIERYQQYINDANNIPTQQRLDFG